MTEHKYTDDEVIRACECCASSELSCTDCPADGTPLCHMSDKLLLEIVQRQRAEIDDLKRDTVPKLQWSLQRANEMGRDLEVELKAMRGAANSYKMHYENAKAEAVKEFAERVKESLDDFFHTDEDATLDTADMIDDLVKEMTRRCPYCKHFVGCEMACGGVPCDEYTEGDTNAE